MELNNSKRAVRCDEYRVGPLRQGKPTHRTDQDVVPTPRVGIGVGVRVS